MKRDSAVIRFGFWDWQSTSLTCFYFGTRGVHFMMDLRNNWGGTGMRARWTKEWIVWNCRRFAYWTTSAFSMFSFLFILFFTFYLLLTLAYAFALALALTSIVCLLILFIISFPNIFLGFLTHKSAIVRISQYGWQLMFIWHVLQSELTECWLSNWLTDLITTHGAHFNGSASWRRFTFCLFGLFWFEKKFLDCFKFGAKIFFHFFL